ncbi:MAG TPA: YHYH protein, partial [Planctomycetaceae bacterium]|nr:YHYH protein [Planctomycetaceae bacterium]
QGELREISSNGIPDHKPGQFPNRHNPNTIREQKYEFRVALHPQPGRDVAPLGMNPFGVALNGVPFDPGAAEFWNRDPNSGWQYEALSGKIDLGLDSSNAHVQPNGAYHYHGIPSALLERLSGGKRRMTLVGYAADGFPVYALYGFADPKSVDGEVKKLKSSYRLKPGTRPGGPRGKYDGSFVQDYEYVAGAGDLDECNGRDGVTPEFPDGTYYYVLTEEYPFIPRFLRGTADATFRRGPPPGGPGGGRRGPPGGPPPRRPRRG